MAGNYQLKKRAQRQEETRRRIVRAAVDLHETIGPARTTVSAIADRAGVQRHTYYRHFPDDRSLFLACSGLYLEENPVPDPEPWRSIADPRKRLLHGLSELYAYYERNERMLSNVTRDAEVHPGTAEINEIRFGPTSKAIFEILAQGLGRGSRRERRLALLRLALDFKTWRSLTIDGGLDPKEAAATMAAAIGRVSSAR
jgi:AcrR family transcriptional regulator